MLLPDIECIESGQAVCFDTWREAALFMVDIKDWFANRCWNVLREKCRKNLEENGRKVHGRLRALLVDMHRDDL